MGIWDNQYSEQGKVNPNAIREGEIIDCILLEEGFPSGYVSQLAAENEKISKEYASVGAEYAPKKPSYRDGGIGWRFAVLNRNINVDAAGNTTFDPVWTPNNDGSMLFEPDYLASGWFTHPIPKHQWEAMNQKTGNRYGDMYARGGDIDINKKNTSQPALVAMMPSVNPAKDFVNGSWISADQVPKGSEIQFASLLDKERQRVAWWTKMMRDWELEGEEECRRWLNMMISRRLLLCHPVVDDNDRLTHWDYLEPKVGMVFRAMATYSGTSKFYFNIISFGKWDSLLGKFPIYSNCNVTYPNEFLVNMARMISQAIEVGKEVRKKNAEEEKKPQKASVAVDDEEDGDDWTKP